MPSVKVKSASDGKGKTLKLSDAVFAVPVNRVLVREALNNHMANQRAGTHCTKTRSEVVGSGRKPFRQKGTGRARQGTNMAPHLRGGGVAFGPKPRDYSYKLGRKKKRQAIVGMLSNLVESERLVVVDAISMDKPNTKSLVERLSGFGVSGKVLVLVEASDRAVVLSARNIKARNSKSVGKREIKEVRARVYNNVNIFDLLICDYLVATVGALEKLQEMYQ